MLAHHEYLYLTVVQCWSYTGSDTDLALHSPRLVGLDLLHPVPPVHLTSVKLDSPL